MNDQFENDDERNPAHEDERNRASDFFQADELAAAWLDEESNPDFDQDQNRHPEIDPHDSARVADLAFLNALLERLYLREAQSMEHRVQCTMNAIEADEAAWKAQSLATPASLLWSSRSVARRFAFSSLSAVAVLLLLVAWYSFPSSTQSAYAAVERAYRDAIQSQDRQYKVTTEVRISTTHSMSIESELTVRGSEKFTLRHPVFLGQCWIGSNGDDGWFVPALGVPRTDDDPVIAMEWARKQGISLPDMHVSALIEYLKKWYDLELLPGEALPGEAEVLWQRVRGIRRAEDSKRCHFVELWAHPETGVARKIVLQWARQPGEFGVMNITLDLIGEKQLADSWYEASSHQPLAIFVFS